MVQEFNVVRCFSCETFQVQQVKKTTNKWSCKLCNEKQSLKQIFFQGTGKECRVNCQALNIRRQTCSNEVEDSAEEDIYGTTNEEKKSNPAFQCGENASARSSNWEQFLDEKTSDNDDDDDNGSTSLLVKFRGEHTTNNARKRKQTTKRNTSAKSTKVSASKTLYGNENIFEDDEFINSADNQSKTWRTNSHHLYKCASTFDTRLSSKTCRTNISANTESEEVYVTQSTHSTPLCDSTVTTVTSNNTAKDYGPAAKEKCENKTMYSESRQFSVQSKWSKFLSVEEEELDDDDDL